MHPSSSYVAHIEQSSSPFKALRYIRGGLVEAGSGNWKIEATEIGFIFVIIYLVFV